MLKGVFGAQAGKQLEALLLSDVPDPPPSPGPADAQLEGLTWLRYTVAVDVKGQCPGFRVKG